MPSISSLSDQAAAPAHVSSTSSASAAALGPAAGPSILPSSGGNPQDALNGALRDGRVRNPVPSKLKGKTDGSKGNFGVMQIEVAGRAEATDRDAEAKRTSESTELAAKRAFENGYVSLRRSRFVHLPDEPVAKPFVPTSTSAPAPAQPQQRAPLGPDETKSEQARLLTLLRSLHPVLVVDQICKALAFFGGIPGAPPPATGGFPESAEANGPGSLFVGWIAEIFPRLGGNSGQQTLDPTRQLDNAQPVKRKRGRPKGSKATKARKDKGVKKGPNKPSTSTGRGQLSGAADESWVDVDDSAVEAADDVSASVMPLEQDASPQRQLGASHLNMGPATPNQAHSAARTALPGAPTGNGVTTVGTVGTPSTRKRGRPKGSKNRPKDLTGNSMQTPGTTSQAGTQLPQGPEISSPVPQAPQVNHTPGLTPGLPGPQSFTAVNSMLPGPTKKRAGKARGPGPKQLEQGQNSQASPASEPHGGSGLGATSSLPTAQAQAAGYLMPQTIQAPQAQTLTLPTAPTASPAQPKLSRNPGQKRKRKGDGNTDASRTPLNDGGNGSASLPDVNGHASPALPSNLRPLPPAAAPEPPPKRQRKGKEPRPPARKGNDAAAQATNRAPVRALGEAPLSDSMPNPSPRPGPAPRAAVAHEPEPALVAASAIEHTMPSVQPPHQGHFEVQSPTMENFEAQLQAQFDQQSEIEPQTLASQSATDSAQLMASRLPQQHQRKFSQQPQHQQQQHQQNDPVGHTRSPNLQSQPAKPQPISSPSAPQQQARTPQSHYNQYRASSSQFQQHQQQKQQTQNYVSSQAEHPQQQQQQQQQQHPFPGGQQHSQSGQAPSAQQYSASTSQQQQYGSNQPPYTASQQQYPNGQQNLASQQRYQHQLATTSSPGAASYTTHQSPQFGASADGSYRSSATALSTASYNQRSQSNAASFRSASTHGVPQHSPPFGTGNTGLQQRSASTSQPTSQSMQGLTNVQAFTGNAAADWGLFDASHLDTSAQQGTMGLSNTNYGLGAASVRTSSNAGPAFAATGLATFDASGLGSSERYYGVGRR
ncbi:hypothetical protein C8A01DRAFT_12047 [Parachaetomium inaequale]|uniref:Uncharacterized protein n=1 Tax=Parachaetomium inaequale TaxID=2588326 RepID=A0AAN6PU21_9PEZI|nr:hypothetical protein C8A01DRAFT_12047 [Parachaetomium inaequale]